jgi:hypothetical protein
MFAIGNVHLFDGEADAFNARVGAHVGRSFEQGGNIDIALVDGGATGSTLSRTNSAPKSRAQERCRA